MTGRRGNAVFTVAIVDDEEDITTYLCFALEDAGYRVVSTIDASKATEILDEALPDLIFLDLLMPEQTGVSLYAGLKKHPRLRDVPIVFLSGLAERDELSSLLSRVGGLPEPEGFIEKPVDIEELLETVGRLLGRPTRATS